MKNVFSIPLAFLILTTSFLATARTERHEISGNWQLHDTKGGAFMPAKVPGVVHLDLLRNGKINDPYLGSTEEKLKWIEEQKWEYVLKFDIDDNLLKNDHVEMVFEGLDTYATVTLNGEEILKSDNMFRQWEVDIKQYLKSGSNELKVLFTPPSLYHKETLKNAPYELPAANETVDQKVSPYTRKAAYQFGWDFSPRFLTAGVWRPVYLRTWNKLRIKDINWTVSEVCPSSAKVDFEIMIESDIDKGLRSIIWDTNEEVAITKGLNPIKQTVIVKNPRIWNPIGRGNQDLQKMGYGIYDQTISLDAIEFEVAFRDIELVHKPDSLGTSFYFRVNGEPLFVKGANYIPQDLFLPRVDSARYEKLIKQVKDANINMLRVWGGGIYENDYFYELCDQNGILVWQDFMFANSMYPSDKAFRENVRAEIEDNVKRLNKHACLALWCGNNEIEVGWNNWGWQEKFGYNEQQSAEIWANYEYIFKEMIPNTLKEHAPNAYYVHTTPLSNWGKTENFDQATMHYWGVWHGEDELEAYRTKIGRFVSEYGFQSYPAAEMLKKYIPVGSFNLNSDEMKNRQKSYVGNELILKAIKKYYGENAIPEEMGLDKWMSASQKVQAHAYSMAIGAHRMDAPRCMGTLFWQLNDCWPGPSWSILDYAGTEKAAYSAVKYAYSPIHVVVNKAEAGQVFVHVQQDGIENQNVEMLVKANPNDPKEQVIWRDNAKLKPLEIWRREIPKANLKAEQISIELIQEEVVIGTFYYYPKYDSMVDMRQ